MKPVPSLPLREATLAIHLLCLSLLAAAPQALEAQVAPNPPGTDHVLRLAGDGGYVELPPHLFDRLTEATIEGWVNWADPARASGSSISATHARNLRFLPSAMRC